MKLIVILSLALVGTKAFALECRTYCVSVVEAAGDFALYSQLTPARVRDLQEWRTVNGSHFPSHSRVCDNMTKKLSSTAEADDNSKGIIVQFSDNGKLIPATLKNSCL